LSSCKAIAASSKSAIWSRRDRRQVLFRIQGCHIYSHCVVVHFAAHPPSKLWPKGVPACSHAEWVASCALAERKASRWRKEPRIEAIEILEARQV
jgi:hypothetical protein